jgi:hypothetical protein
MKHGQGVSQKTHPGSSVRLGTTPTSTGLQCKPAAAEAVRQCDVVQASEVLHPGHSTFQHEQLTSDARIVKTTSQFTFNVRAMVCLAVVAPEV